MYPGANPPQIPQIPTTNLVSPPIVHNNPNSARRYCSPKSPQAQLEPFSLANSAYGELAQAAASTQAVTKRPSPIAPKLPPKPEIFFRKPDMKVKKESKSLLSRTVKAGLALWAKLSRR
jgi:hypothetical protein